MSELRPLVVYFQKPMRRAIFLLPLAFLFFAARPICAQSHDQNHRENQGELHAQIPAGTVLPVRLDETLSVRKTRAGQRISARIMQDVPLPNEGKIAEGSRVVGTVVSVEPAAQGEGGKISFR